MTRRDTTTGDGLASAFGPAAASRTRARPPRPTGTASDDHSQPRAASRDGRGHAADGGRRAAAEPDRSRVDRGGPTRRSSHGEADDPAPAVRQSDRRPGRADHPAAPRRRTRPIVVRDPHQVDMILLAVLEQGPRTRAALLDLGTTRAAGRIVPAREQVIRRLGHLERNRLVRRGADRRYRVTAVGARILASRVQRWRVFVGAIEALLGDDRGGRGHPAA